MAELPDPQALINGLTAQEHYEAGIFGIQPGQYRQAMQYTGGAPIIGGLPVSASKGQFTEDQRFFEAIYWGDSPNPLNSAMHYYDDEERGYEPSVQFNPFTNPKKPFEPQGTPVGYGKRIGNREDPAPITLVPTSTTNPTRPRTVAAGYDSPRGVLTCVFRDGTYYNYYEVNGLTWANFKRARSKGRFIYTYLDAHPRGMADVLMMPQPGREILYRVTRTHQVMAKGLQAGHSSRSPRGTGYGPKNGGTARKRAKRA